MNHRTFIRVTLPLASVNALTQVARTIMSTVGPLIAAQYNLNAGKLGLLSAAMFASYCLVQIPAGIAMDRWGPRRTQAILCCVAVLGFALFATSDDLPGFLAGRMLTGIGVSAGLIGMIRGNSEWFPRQDVARVTGLGMAVGTVGSFLATTPAQAALPVIGWHGVIWCCAGASALVGLWNLLSVPEIVPRTTTPSLQQDVRALHTVIRSPVFRKFAPLASLMTVLNFTYLGLWAGPWLRDVAHLGAQLRAQVLLLYTVGLFLGGPFTGGCVSAAQKRGLHPMLVPAVCTVGLILLQIALACRPEGIVLLGFLWFAFALFVSCGPAAYAAVAGYFSTSEAGRVSTAVNTLTLALVFSMQIVIGQLVDFWPRDSHGGWNPAGYSLGLLITVILQMAALSYAWRDVSRQ